MSDDNNSTTEPADNATAAGPAPETDAKDWKAEAEKWQALARKNEERAKGNAAAVKELEQLKAANLTETEKAVAEAERRGHAAATTAGASRLARAELRAAAAGQVDKAAMDGFLEYADLAKFVGDDGEPDTKAIERAVKALAGEPKTTNFDGGARRTAEKPTDMNQLIRAKAGLS